MNKKLFIIAGEPSGDLHGSNLIKAILAKSADTQFVGLGGELMRLAGCRLFYDIKDTSVVGFAEVLKKLPAFKKLFKSLLAKLDSEKPDAVILIDYPGFNLRFAKEAKKRNIPVIYYISPQVWAWHKGRIKIIKKLVDRMLVIFEFEKDLYRQYGVEAVFVGHPLVDTVKTKTVGAGLAPARPVNGRPQGPPLQSDKKIIALLPGSRKTEVQKVLPIMLKSAEIIVGAGLEPAPTQFILIKSPIVDRRVYDDIVGARPSASPRGEHAVPLHIVDRDRYDAVACADFALVASGTATLETAILGVPMALVYKVSFLTWLLARMLIKIPYIGLVNVVAGKKIIPEFIQFGARPKKIAAECLAVLNSPQKAAQIKTQITEVKSKLGAPGASQKAAEEIFKFLETYHPDCAC